MRQRGTPVPYLSIYLMKESPHLEPRHFSLDSTGEAWKAVGDRLPRIFKTRFVRTIPLPWITAASRLAPKVLAVAVALWYVAGKQRSRKVTLTGKALAQFHVGRSVKYRALCQLEDAGLIRATKVRGRNPVVELIIDPAPQSLNCRNANPDEIG